MRLSGSVEIHVVDAATGVVQQTIKQNNLIPNQTLIDLLGYDIIPYNQFYSCKICISTSTDIPSLNNYKLSGVIGAGYVPQNVESPTFNDGIDPPFLQVQNRIDYTGSDRTFNSVGLGRNVGASISDVKAYLKLDTPCVQGAYQYLDIFYRIQFANAGGQNFSDEARLIFGKATIGKDSFALSNLTASPFNKPTMPYQKLLYSGVGLAYAYNNNDNTVNWTNGYVVPDHFKFKYILQQNKDFAVGTIFKSMIQGKGNSNNAFTCSTFNYDKEPFQTGFWHDKNATTPFFDASHIGASGGTVILDGTWTNKIPELYKITITDSGAVGTAKYKLSIKKHVGFNDGSFETRPIGNPFKNLNFAAASGFHGWRDVDFDIQPYSPTQIVQYDDTGLTLLDLFNGDYTNFDSTTTPALAATQIRQVAVDSINHLIYVACRATGLWIINVTANTIVHQLNGACYGVDVGRNNIATAIIAGGMYRSNNWTTPITFTYTGITDNKWSNVKFIKCDPEHSNDRMAIVAEVNSGSRRIVWYQLSDNSTVDGWESGQIKTHAGMLDVSDTGSFWATWIFKLNFGDITNTFYSGSYDGLNLTPGLGVEEGDWILKVAFYKDKLITHRNGLRDINSNTVSTYPDLSHIICSLGDGMILSGSNVQSVTNNALYWQDYGWDGTKWVEGNVTSKPTHADAQSLLNGLTIKFNNAIQQPHFTATDYFTQGVNYGLLKDNATEINYQSQWYSKPAQFDSTATGTIPSAPPYLLQLNCVNDPAFVRVETDSPELHSFQIAGQSIATLYVKGETPGPNEISMVAIGDGVLRFNAADAGKTFTATKYAWIKN